MRSGRWRALSATRIGGAPSRARPSMGLLGEAHRDAYRRCRCSGADGRSHQRLRRQGFCRRNSVDQYADPHTERVAHPECAPTWAGHDPHATHVPRRYSRSRHRVVHCNRSWRRLHVRKPHRPARYVPPPWDRDRLLVHLPREPSRFHPARPDSLSSRTALESVCRRTRLGS